jgi:hypothetical protein
VRPKHVLIEFKKWMCYIDGQKNKYSVLNECNRMLKYNVFYSVNVELDHAAAQDINRWFPEVGHVGNLQFQKRCFIQFV